MAQPSEDSKNSPKSSAVPRSVTATFHTDPPTAQVWRQSGEGQVNYLGEAGKALVIGLTEQESRGDRDLLIEFRVPLGSSEWKSKPYFVAVKKLRESGNYPETGTLELSLSARDLLASGVWTDLLFKIGGLATVLAIVFLAFRRQTTRRPEEIPLIRGVTLLERLGQGGMGDVYAALGSDGEELAVKMMKAQLSDTPEQQARFDREIQIGLKLSHPNLVQLYAYGVATDGRVYLSSERLYGETLKERLQKPDIQRAQLAFEVLEQVGSALDYLTDQDLIHRDVKPDNIYLCRDGTIKLMDLGIAQMDSLPALTHAGLTMGTPAYMAPEQVKGFAGIHTDQYALGLVLFEILTGQRAFQGNTIEALVHQHAKVEPPNPRDLDERILEPISSALLKMLNKDPEQRFQNLAVARETMRETLSKLSW